MPLNSSDFYIP